MSRQLAGLFDKTMTKSAFVLVPMLYILLIIELFGSRKFTPVNIALSALLVTAWSFFQVFLIRHIRGNRVSRRKYPEIACELGVWGYIWHALLIKYLSLFAAAAIMVLLSIRSAIPSIEHTIISLMFSVFMSIFFAWLIFSSDRKGQFRWFFSLIGGY